MKVQEQWWLVTNMGYIKELDNQYVAPTYNRFDVELVSGKGSLFLDTEGKSYIDLTSGIGVTAFGTADEEWINAINTQLNKLQHTSNLFYTEPCAKLAELLCKKTGMSKVFFANSGAEANECAIKIARKYAMDKKGADYYNIITIENSFHGRTLTTLAATGQKHYHELFNPLTPGFIHTPAEDIETLKVILAEKKCAAIMLECVQGEGGVVPLSEKYLKGVYELAKKKDILLIIDEVQTGNGRTGELYAYMNYDITPDIITTAKGLGGGLPIGAAIMSDKVKSVLGFGDHGSTYGGNPVCCAAAYEILSRIDDNLLNEIKAKSKFIFEFLSNIKGVKEVSGLGLMVGIKTDFNSAEIVKECIEKGVLCLTAKDKIRLLPALNIPMELLEEALKILKTVIEERYDKNG